MLLTRYFSFDDVSAEQAWTLLDWCRDRGAGEFTVTALLIGGTESERTRAFFEGLATEALPDAPRRVLSASGLVTVPLWRLSPVAVEQLRRGFPDGFASHRLDADLWLENLTVYRGGEFMMGVLSHEHGGVLRLTAAELDEARRTGLRDRDQCEWITY